LSEDISEGGYVVGFVGGDVKVSSRHVEEKDEVCYYMLPTRKEEMDTYDKLRSPPTPQAQEK
jgi:hypothetical protein